MAINLRQERSSEELEDGIIIYQNFLDVQPLGRLLAAINDPQTKWTLGKAVDNTIPPEFVNSFDDNPLHQRFPECEAKYNLHATRLLLDFSTIFEPDHYPSSNASFAILSCLCSTLEKYLNVDTWKRIKINRTFATDKIVEHGFHVDHLPLTDKAQNGTTAILHLDNSNGYTKFAKNNIKIPSKQNQLIAFPTHLYHTGTTCTDQSFRTVINFNFY